MSTAVCPGSYDPVTIGHVDVFERAAKMFDEVMVLVVPNPDKKYCFTAEERVQMIREATAHIPNVRVGIFFGMIADYIHEHPGSVLVKGIRDDNDFSFERIMAVTNRKLSEDCETLFLNSRPELMHISSTLVRQSAAFGREIKDFVPDCVYGQIKERLTRQ